MIRTFQFRCKSCGKPITLHAGTILQPFASQDIQPNDSHSVAVPCFLCKKVGIYSHDQNSPYFDPTYRVVSPDHIVETEPLGWLKCDTAGCRFHAPLFSVMTISMTDEERLAEIASWKYDDLRCPAGHSMGNTLWKP